MTINYGPVCTCGQSYWSTVPMPCPIHGLSWRWSPPSTGTVTTFRVCQGRHCAHDYQCNHYWIGG